MKALFVIDDAMVRSSFGAQETVPAFGYRVATVRTALRMIDFGYCPDLIVRALPDADEDQTHLIPIAKRLDIPMVYYSTTNPDAPNDGPPSSDFLFFHFDAVSDLFAAIASDELRTAAVRRRTVLSLEETRTTSRAVMEQLMAFGYG
tara:strand:- start:735 stop:1175 length:441 start_codon:yes stop_codon:yes gene_type:complete